MRDQVGKLSSQWQRKGHKLGFGVGIASGYATLGQIGFEQRREYTAIGSVINLASRLCDEARPGQIVIAQRAFSYVEQDVEAASIGELSLKGFTDPVAAYEITSWRGPIPTGRAGRRSLESIDIGAKPALLAVRAARATETCRTNPIGPTFGSFTMPATAGCLG